MTQIILIVIGVAVIVILLSRESREKIVGICAAALEQDAKKLENKEKILALLREGSGETKELSNSDIRSALGVSDRSVIRYMDELEREGKVEQVGHTGRAVSYRLK
ncbi:MAG: winged helix-turn-helix transcriptional regulator [Patescibacteria group bacterium]